MGGATIHCTLDLSSSNGWNMSELSEWSKQGLLFCDRNGHSPDAVGTTCKVCGATRAVAAARVTRREGMREQIGLTIHNVNNALSPLFMVLEEMETIAAVPDTGVDGGWSLSLEDTRVCLERIRDAMQDLKKSGEP